MRLIFIKNCQRVFQSVRITLHSSAYEEVPGSALLPGLRLPARFPCASPGAGAATPLTALGAQAWRLTTA